MKGGLFLMLLGISQLAVGRSEGCRLKFKAPVYNQCDERWGSRLLGGTMPMCKVGSLTCSLASALTALLVDIDDQTATPDVLNAHFRANDGYYGNVHVLRSLENHGLIYQGQTSSLSQIKLSVCDQKMVFLNVEKGTHWTFATGYEDDRMFVMDPLEKRQWYEETEVVVAAIFVAS